MLVCLYIALQSSRKAYHFAASSRSNDMPPINDINHVLYNYLIVRYSLLSSLPDEVTYMTIHLHLPAMINEYRLMKSGVEVITV